MLLTGPRQPTEQSPRPTDAAMPPPLVAGAASTRSRPSMISTTAYVGLAVLLVVALVPLAVAAPIATQVQALPYLVQFGYMEGGTGAAKGSLVSQSSIKNAIQDFQRFAGLNQTGEMDNETVVMMNMPRCGVKDKVGHGLEARRKRYTLQGSRWRVKELTYRLAKYPSARISKSDVDAEIKKAFQVWSDHTNLKFVAKSSGRVHIDVKFEKREHGDGDPFDGQGGTLAHAYFPIYGGDAHFDDEERWTINSYRGTNLFQVAAHEFGHSLGLSHSDVQAALMAPFYRGYEPNFKMHKDDIRGIQSLYGEKTGESPSKNSPGSPTPRPTVGKPPGEVEEGELCSNSAIDTVFQSKKRTFAFKGELYWEVADEGLADGYPRSIAKDWDNLPANIDASFTWTNGKTYFFKGSQYWRYSERTKDSGYPKSVSEGFKGIPDKIDAAFIWSGNDKIYFFKGSKYWKFDPERNPPVGKEYPKEVSNWDGIPNNIDAAFQWTNGYTYFFKDTMYWRFNDRTFSVDKANPPFPRSSAAWWFGCKAMSSDNEHGGLIASGLANDEHEDRLDVVDDIADAGLHQPHPSPTQGALQNSGHALKSTAIALVLGLALHLFRV